MTFSFAATLGGLTLFVRELLREYGQDGVLGNAPGFEAICVHETNVTARRCRCLWGVETVAVTANEAVVPVGRVFAIESGQVKDGAERWVPLNLMTEAQLDRWDDRRIAEGAEGVVRWRNLVAVPVPQVYIWRDAGMVQLVPPPSVSKVGALQFRGWAEPGEAWATSDAASYPLAARFLPLTAHQVAIALVSAAGGDGSRLMLAESRLLATLVPRAMSSNVSQLTDAMRNGEAG